MRPFVRLLAFGLAALLIGSCGGGGGVAVSSLTYRTTWTDGASQSQLVALATADGTPVSSRTLNRGREDSSTVFEGLAPGNYVLSGRLYSQSNLGGQVLGEISAAIAVVGGARFDTVTSGTPVQVTVSPIAASIPVGETQRFRATAFVAGGRALFVPNPFVWAAEGSAASVDQQGIALGVEVGTAVIRATNQGVAGTATLDVEPSQTVRTKWNVLVFLNAANDLYPFSELNINQMERVASNPDVRFIVQWKQSQSQFPQSTFDGTRRYLVQPDNTPAIASKLVQDLGAGVDMGIPSTLREFIEWAKVRYPADRTVLVIWNHGNGWRREADQWSGRAVSYDDETLNAIQAWQLQEALGSEVFDIIAWDASLMQMLEVATEVAGNARYIVGSEESPPGEGYPYDRIFAAFRDSPDDTTANLSKAFVDGMLAVPEYQNRKITQSVLDASRVPHLVTAVDVLAGALIANRDELLRNVPYARDNAQAYSPTSTRFFRDLWDLTLKLEEAQNTLDPLPQSVLAANVLVRAAISQTVVWEGHNLNSPGSRGVSIDFSPGLRFAAFSFDYRMMKFAQQTRWDEWLIVAP